MGADDGSEFDDLDSVYGVAEPGPQSFGEHRGAFGGVEMMDRDPRNLTAGSCGLNSLGGKVLETGDGPA